MKVTFTLKDVNNWIFSFQRRAEVSTNPEAIRLSQDCAKALEAFYNWNRLEMRMKRTQVIELGSHDPIPDEEKEVFLNLRKSEVEFLQEIIRMFQSKAGFNFEFLPVEGQSLIEKIERISKE